METLIGKPEHPVMFLLVIFAWFLLLSPLCLLEQLHRTYANVFLTCSFPDGISSEVLIVMMLLIHSVSYWELMCNLSQCHYSIKKETICIQYWATWNSLQFTLISLLWGLDSWFASLASILIFCFATRGIVANKASLLERDSGGNQSTAEPCACWMNCRWPETRTGNRITERTDM